MPVLCYTGSVKVARQLQLHRSLFPMVAPHGLGYGHGKVPVGSAAPAEAIKEAASLGWVKSGDVVAVVAVREDHETLHRPVEVTVATVV